LTTDAGKELAAHGVGGDLTREIDGRGVDRDHSSIFGNDEWVVDEVARLQLHLWILVDPVVEVARAHHERGHHPTRTRCLFRASDDARLGQVHEPV